MKKLATYFKNRYVILVTILVSISVIGTIAYFSQTKRYYATDASKSDSTVLVVTKKNYIEYNEISQSGKLVHDGKEESFSISNQIGRGDRLYSAQLNFKNKDFHLTNFAGLFTIEETNEGFVDLNSAMGKMLLSENKIKVTD